VNHTSWISCASYIILNLPFRLAKENSLAYYLIAMIEKPKILIKRLRGGAVIPSYQTEGSAGMDLSLCGEAKTINPGERALLPTGISVAIPSGFEGQVRPRSGLALRHGIILPNSPGTIDSDYRGEICVIAANIGADPITFQPGDRIAQLVIAPVTTVEIEEVNELPTTNRGAGGFGSTGQ